MQISSAVYENNAFAHMVATTHLQYHADSARARKTFGGRFCDACRLARAREDNMEILMERFHAVP